MSLEDFNSNTEKNIDSINLDDSDKTPSAEFFLGFIAGEGSFSIGISQGQSRISVSPIFTIKLEQVDATILKYLSDSVNIGYLTEGHDRGRDYILWRVSSLDECLLLARKIDEISEDSIFKATSKYESFKVWKNCLDLMNKDAHLTAEGIKKIARLRDDMNDDRRGRTADEVIEDLDIE